MRTERKKDPRRKLAREDVQLVTRFFRLALKAYSRIRRHRFGERVQCCHREIILARTSGHMSMDPHDCGMSSTFEFFWIRCMQFVNIPRRMPTQEDAKELRPIKGCSKIPFITVSNVHGSLPFYGKAAKIFSFPRLHLSERRAVPTPCYESCVSMVKWPQAYFSLSLLGDSGTQHTRSKMHTLRPLNDLLINRVCRVIHQDSPFSIVKLAIHTRISDEVDDPLLAFVLVETETG